jgi:hypothetical protein
VRTWTETVTHREGENMGPIDWEHPLAKDKPALWREAEKRPTDFRLDTTGFSAFPVFEIAMYDGWPYWKPTPAILIKGPLGKPEWRFFNDYGINDGSLFEAKP